MADDTPFELELTAMAHGGSALGRHEGRAVFVPYAIPGERILARLTRDRGRFAVAEVVSVLVPSEARVEPRCPHFGPGRCGGCHWQHIDYPAQLEFKRQVVIDQMASAASDVTVHPTIPSPDPWRYRSHISFHVTEDGRLGFVSTDDRTVIPIEECHIIRPELLELFNDLKRRVKNHSTSVFSPLQSGEGSGVRSNVERVRLQVGSDGSAGDGGVEKVHYTVKGRTFQISAGSFFQVNLAQAETLVDLVMVRLAQSASSICTPASDCSRRSWPGARRT
jgi:23S rRNA (uracil1939-C5)-methyltransferase